MVKGNFLFSTSSLFLVIFSVNDFSSVLTTIVFGEISAVFWPFSKFFSWTLSSWKALLLVLSSPASTCIVAKVGSGHLTLKHTQFLWLILDYVHCMNIIKRRGGNVNVYYCTILTCVDVASSCVTWSCDGVEGNML